MTHSSLRGIDDSGEWGRMSVNYNNMFTRSCSMEVHLHPSDDHNMAISPNNGVMQLNLTLPVVNFFIAICTMNNNSKNHFSIFKYFFPLTIHSVTIVNDDTLRISRELDSCLSTQKIFSHTPVRS